MKQKLRNTSVVLAWIDFLPQYTKLLAVSTAKNNQNSIRTLNFNCLFNHLVSNTFFIINEKSRYIMQKMNSDQLDALENNLLIKVL